jgi:probable phosphoglycerate mutase
MSSNLPPRLFYFRHGETPWSLSGQHSSVTDVPLTAHGERQARALRPWTATISFAHAFTSPRLRARATCELAGLGVQAIIEPDLAEWNYGDYEGRHSGEIKEGRSGWEIFRDGCPSGEQPDEIGARADRLIGRLRAIGGDIALFAHGQFGSVFVARWIGLATVEGRHFSVGPASMGILSWNRDHPEIPVVALWNAAPNVPA